MNRTFVLIIFLLASFNSWSQIYLDKSYSKVENREDAKYYKLVDTASNIITEKMYLMNDTLLEVANYSNTKEKLKEGKNYRYYESGKLKYDIDYYQGRLNGYVKGYFENGNPKRLDKYKNDTLIEGKCYAVSGVDTTYYIFEKNASYKGGGIIGFHQFVVRQVKYPSEAQSKGIQGRVIVQFSVNWKGKVVDIVIIESPHILLSEAAIEAINKSGTWEPAIQEGRRVKQNFIIPINFTFE